MQRRALLKSAGLGAGALAFAGALAACGEGEPVQPGGRQPSPDPDEPAGRATTRTSAGEEQTLTVISASFETLTGQGRRFAFAVATSDNQPLRDADLEVVLRDLDGNQLGGPFAATFVPMDGPMGVYTTRIDVPQAGHVLLAVTDGHDVGEVAVNVVAPEDSQLPVPGQKAVVTATPTVAEQMGLAELCTRPQGDCGMHDVSLDEALAAGRPVALLFATPAYCQTAVCGPAVDNLDAVRADGDWGEVAFIHVEIFSDAGRTLTDPVQEWELPTEPWLFTIAGDGTIADRLDAIMVPDELRAMVTELA